MSDRRPVVDLTDEEARRALVLKWGTVPADVIPAWVAEMDYALDPVLREALLRAVRDGVVGYPVFGATAELSEAYAGFAARHYGSQVDPAWMMPVVDVTAGVRFVLDLLSDDGPVVFPVPGYSPQLAVAEMTGRERVDLVVDADAARAEIDLDRLDAMFAAGARTLLLTQPHNPWGRVFSRAELEGIRDVVVRHGARVVSTRSMRRWCCPAPCTRRTSTSRARTTTPSRSSPPRRRSTPPDCGAPSSWCRPPRTVLGCTPLPWRATTPGRRSASSRRVAAYRDGDPWLASLVERLDQLRTLLGDLLAEHLPELRMRPLEATYLAWLDVRAYGHDDPAAVAFERGRVKLGPGHDFVPGLAGHARLNLATSPDRLTEIVRRLAEAWT